jgi:hypothetical protein
MGKEFTGPSLMKTLALLVCSLAHIIHTKALLAEAGLITVE